MYLYIIPAMLVSSAISRVVPNCIVPRIQVIEVSADEIRPICESCLISIRSSLDSTRSNLLSMCSLSSRRSMLVLHPGGAS